MEFRATDAQGEILHDKVDSFKGFQKQYHEVLGEAACISGSFATYTLHWSEVLNLLKGDDDRYPAGGEATKGAWRVSELTGRALKLAGRAPDPDGRA